MIVAVAKSDLEALLSMQLRALGAPEPTREFVFAKPRRWRFDFCWPERNLAVEVNGGSWVNGRHNRPQGQRQDNEKLNAAVMLGWRVLRYTGDKVEDGTAVGQILTLLQ